MKSIVVCLCSFLVLITGDQHPNTNGAFGKYHAADELQVPYGCNRPANLSYSSVLANVSTLTLSTTVYSNGEEINVTWTPFSTTCANDFIGVYSSDMSDSEGKYILSIVTIFFLFQYCFSMWLF